MSGSFAKCKMCGKLKTLNDAGGCASCFGDRMIVNGRAYYDSAAVHWIEAEVREAAASEERARVVTFLRAEAANQLENLGALSDDIGIRACAELIEEGGHIAKADGGDNG